MPIDYSRLREIMKAKGVSFYRLHKEEVIGGTTRQKLLGRHPGGIDSHTIEVICKRLEIQPGDFMEYVPDENSTKERNFENEKDCD